MLLQILLVVSSGENFTRELLQLCVCFLLLKAFSQGFSVGKSPWDTLVLNW